MQLCYARYFWLLAQCFTSPPWRCETDDLGKRLRLKPRPSRGFAFFEGPSAQVCPHNRFELIKVRIDAVHGAFKLVDPRLRN